MSIKTIKFRRMEGKHRCSATKIFLGPVLIHIRTAEASKVVFDIKSYVK